MKLGNNDWINSIILNTGKKYISGVCQIGFTQFGFIKENDFSPSLRLKSDPLDLCELINQKLLLDALNLDKIIYCQNTSCKIVTICIHEKYIYFLYTEPSDNLYKNENENKENQSDELDCRF